MLQPKYFHVYARPTGIICDCNAFHVSSNCVHEYLLRSNVRQILDTLPLRPGDPAVVKLKIRTAHVYSVNTSRERRLTVTFKSGAWKCSIHSVTCIQIHKCLDYERRWQEFQEENGFRPDDTSRPPPPTVTNLSQPEVGDLEPSNGLLEEETDEDTHIHNAVKADEQAPHYRIAQPVITGGNFR